MSRVYRTAPHITVTRGANSSPVATHANGVTVRGNLLFAPGTTVQLVGNIVGAYQTSAQRCTLYAANATSFAPSYRNNLFGQVQSSSSTKSDASDTNGTGTFVDNTSQSANLSLANGSLGIDGGENTICGPGNPVAIDLFGTPRFLGTACDQGAGPEK